MTSRAAAAPAPDAVFGTVRGVHEQGILGPGSSPLVRTSPDELVAVLRALREIHGFTDLALLTAEELAPQDGGPDQTPADREVIGGVRLVYGLTRRSDHSDVYLYVDLDDSALTAPTISGLWSGAAALEREVYDLYGVTFAGHPLMTRIVLRDDFRGHPLRKSFVMHPDGVSADEVAAAAATHGDYHLDGRRAHRFPDVPGLTPASLADPEGFATEQLVISMGPQHPSTHGVLHLWLVLDGETVVAAHPTHGYLHRCIEKLCESHDYRACIPLMDRCDYVSGFHTELAMMLALEELMGIESTPKADHLRLIMSELIRITSHHTWYAAAGLDTGALTPFLYAFIDRELICDFFEEITGGRMMFNYFRPGGVKDDLPPGIANRMIEYLRGFDRAVDEYEALLTGNEIFRARTRGVGLLSRAAITDYCVTGPMARASGVDIDLRRDRPYAAYDRIPVNVALAEAGDTFDRYIVRIAEMRESARLALAALEGLPEGPHVSDSVPRSLKPPKGAAYRAVESPRGELGVYLVSDGTSSPWRLKVRSPAFSNIHAVGPMLEGLRVGDVVAVVGSVDVVMGEIDR